MDFSLDGFRSYVTIELGLCNATLSAYCFDVRQFLQFVGDNEITGLSIETFLGELRSTGSKSATLRRKCMSIRCFLHHLVSIGGINGDILKTIDPIRVERKTYDSLDDDIVSLFISSLRGPNVRRDVAIVLMLYHSGLRVSELCNLNLSDANLNGRKIRVCGKGCCERIVPITSECREAIKSYIDMGRGDSDGPLFVTGTGNRITRQTISDLITRVSNKCGTPNTTPHTLRRSCATNLMRRGMELELIQNLLGHQELSTTQAYLAIRQEDLVTAYKRYHPKAGEVNEAIA